MQATIGSLEAYVARPGSVGIVTPQKARFDQMLKLRSGATIEGYELAYETYGR
jgi:homoserine O-acetyltransferase